MYVCMYVCVWYVPKDIYLHVSIHANEIGAPDSVMSLTMSWFFVQQA